MSQALQFQPGTLVSARGREWVVLPQSDGDILHLRPLGGAEEDAVVLSMALEPEKPRPATFALPDPQRSGNQATALLLRDALRLKLRAGAGPFRSFGNLSFEPRAYQLVPLLMALKLDPLRLLIADDVGIGKTIEAGLIARELLDRGEITRLSVVCPPHLCEQWQRELSSKFNLQAEIVRTGTAGYLERGLPAGKSVFEFYPFTIVSLDYIKAGRRRDEFLRACPEFVIVEEAHTCVQAGTDARHQRYLLLRGLAENPARHMVFLTATPHSGNDPAFDNLLGLLSPKFHGFSTMTEEQRQKIREDLADHVVQRRRADIAEWKDSTFFPDRQSRDCTYEITGAWGELFEEILKYSRELIQDVKGKSTLQQTMCWWAVLALLRCASSSPAAAAIALRTRFKAMQGLTEAEQAVEIEKQGIDTVLEGDSDDLLSFDENAPAAALDSVPELSSAARKMADMIDHAEQLKGPSKDPKLAEVIRLVKELVKEGFNPVVFCRYIATAHYVAAHLETALKNEKMTIMAVTGDLTPDEREDKVAELGRCERRLLVATDCLSEGINLQNAFDAIVHYDLSWNPTRHEQREGRVDRFGQPKKVVRTVMFYGANNPVDLTVLNVLLRKAGTIQKALGVSVPIPVDCNKLIRSSMEHVLTRSYQFKTAKQELMDFGEVERKVETEWNSAKERAHQSRTIFAQRRLQPKDVMPEWEKTTGVLGGAGDVERFVTEAARRLGAPLAASGGAGLLPVAHLPSGLRERLGQIVPVDSYRISFSRPVPSGAEFVHRAHPLVSVLADEIVERALDEKPEFRAIVPVAVRSGALFTKEVSTRTTIYLLRLRCQITVEKREKAQFLPAGTLLAEECVVVGIVGSDAPRLLTESEALALMAAEPAPGKSMEPDQRSRQVQHGLTLFTEQQRFFEQLADRRAEELLADHQRIRKASDARGRRYSVTACKPIDLIGLYVLLPVPTL